MLIDQPQSASIITAKQLRHKPSTSRSLTGSVYRPEAYISFQAHTNFRPFTPCDPSMDSLPFGIVSRIARFRGYSNGKPCFSSYATISRAWEAAIERSSFGMLTIKPDIGYQRWFNCSKKARNQHLRVKELILRPTYIFICKLPRKEYDSSIYSKSQPKKRYQQGII
jgi:hypothetical protein